MIVTSTSDVYGNATPPFAEDDHVVIGPSTTRRWAYAVSKLYDEHIALAMAEEKGLRPVILRLFNVYGPRNHPTWWGGPVTAFTEALLDGEIMDLHGDGRQVRTFTYVSDTVDGFVRALDTPDAVGEILNIGGDEPITMIRLATAVQEALGIAGPLRAKLLPYEKIGGRYQDVRCRIPDTEKASRVLGFNASVESGRGPRRQRRLARGAPPADGGRARQRRRVGGLARPERGVSRARRSARRASPLARAARVAVSTSATRPAACPSQSGIADGVGGRAEGRDAGDQAGSSPSSTLVPCVIVTGRSVLARNV